MRHIKKVTTWEEGMLSFWITLPCLVIGIVLLILPTVFLLHWICRLFIWICLGPWLRIYCEFFVFEQNHALDCDEKRDQYAKQISQKITEQFDEIERVARVKGEHAIKMKSLRILRFGKYIAKVPSMNVTRWYDFPTSKSSATSLSCVPEHKMNKRRLLKTVPSQRLIGHMIPMTEEQIFVFDKNSRREPTIKEESSKDEIDDDGTIEKSEDYQTKSSATDQNTYGHEAVQPIDTQAWLNNAVSQLGTSLSLKPRRKAPLPTETPEADEPCSKENTDDSIKIDLDDSILHVTAKTLLLDVNDDDDDVLTHDSTQYFEYGNNCLEEEEEEEGVEIVVVEENEVTASSDIQKDDISQVTNTSLSTVFQSTQGIYVAIGRSPSSNKN